jgi:hypothetical protein
VLEIILFFSRLQPGEVKGHSRQISAKINEGFNYRPERLMAFYNFFETGVTKINSSSFYEGFRYKPYLN